ncbi:MAG: thiamine pyrophosphate-binding protein [Nitrospirae bacterium]|nr:thiamine pyrophosphate-binding protein [Nitrospirota bacterium]MBF0591148.1 thiamine pyrophosphate-binding protein [Nitrospirota bacterium]
MAGKTGRYKIIEQLLADGMTYMFGNPGTVEQGFLDAMRDYPAMQYILTLQESIAVMTADGYARATQKPTLVQLHSSPGIGNAVGALYQARRGHSPLVVIAGDAGLSYLNMDAQMAGDLVAFMAPVTKYATMVMDSRSLLRTLRRAIKIAATPPMGPVYVCLPMDVLDEINNEEVFPTLIPSTRVLPEARTIESAAEALLKGQTPVIFVGDGVAYSNANDELTRVAELLGAEVYAADIGDVVMDTTHPLYKGTTGHMTGSYSLPITKKADSVLIVGTYMLPEVFPELGDIFAPGAKVVHFDLNAYEIAKNHRVDIAAVSDPKLSLAALANELQHRISPQYRAEAYKRTDISRQAKTNNHNTEVEADQKAKNNTSIHMSDLASRLADILPKDAILFDEALTSSPAVTRYLQPRMPGSYFVTRGGSLGVGIPGAIGAKLANPNKTVIGFTGDGGSMYTIQALYTAARYNIGAKFVICNNGVYQLLNLNINQYWKERDIAAHPFPDCFNLSGPDIRFDRLAEAMAVNSMRIDNPAHIDQAVKAMFADDRPYLLDVVLR